MKGLVGVRVAVLITSTACTFNNSICYFSPPQSLLHSTSPVGFAVLSITVRVWEEAAPQGGTPLAPSHRSLGTQGVLALLLDIVTLFLLVVAARLYPLIVVALDDILEFAIRVIWVVIFQVQDVLPTTGCLLLRG